MGRPQKTYDLRSLADTRAAGAALASQLQWGDIVNITGPLGAGKTTLVKEIVRALGGDAEAVRSPTFTLVHQYQTASFDIFHCDFYRLPEGAMLEEFGGAEFFCSAGVYLVEWPERIKQLELSIPNRLLEADLQSEGERRVMRLSGPWQIVD